MPEPTLPPLLPALLTALAVAGCSHATGVASGAPGQATVSTPGGPLPVVKAPLDPGRFPFTAADVHFMTGMIAHHAQAVKMAGWAASHGASRDVQAMCARIVVGQTDEIHLMQTWLAERGQKVPPADQMRMRMTMGGMEHDMLMPGMLSDEEMAELDRARGREFDRLFLVGMIKHHLGAIEMVDELFAAPGAGQDEVVFRFASDVWADQSTEIDRMQKMLTSLQGTPR